jgi:hypothetical protein
VRFPAGTQTELTEVFLLFFSCRKIPGLYFKLGHGRFLPHPHSLTHGAEPFLRSYQLCSYLRTSQYFIEPEGSLQCSLVHVQCQINPIHTIPSNLPEIHFNIVHPPTSFKWSLSIWLSHQYPTCIPPLPNSCYIPCTAHPS